MYITQYIKDTCVYYGNLDGNIVSAPAVEANLSLKHDENIVTS